MAKQKVYTQATVLFNNVDVNFPSLVTPTSSPLNPNKHSYRLSIPLPKDKPVLVDGKSEDIMKVIERLLTQHFGKEAGKIAVKIEGDKQKIFIVDGDNVKKKDGTEVEFLKGKYQVTITTPDSAPHIYYDADSRKITHANKTAWEEEGKKIKQGSVANVAAQIWIQDNDFGVGVRCKLLAVQFVKEGSAGAQVETQNLFGTIERQEEVVTPIAKAPFGSAPSFVDDEE